LAPIFLQNQNTPGKPFSNTMAVDRQKILPEKGILTKILMDIMAVVIIVLGEGFFSIRFFVLTVF
jgi:hypothetical protein